MSTDSDDFGSSGAEPAGHAALPEALRKLASGRTRAFLVTLRKDGSPTAHPMTSYPAVWETEAPLRFNTYRKSAKVRNIERDPRVCAVYLRGYAPDQADGFAVHGRASLGSAAELAQPGAVPEDSILKRAAERSASGKRVYVQIEPAEVRAVHRPKKGDRSGT